MCRVLRVNPCQPLVLCTRRRVKRSLLLCREGDCGVSYTGLPANSTLSAVLYDTSLRHTLSHSLCCVAGFKLHIASSMNPSLFKTPLQYQGPQELIRPGASPSFSPKQRHALRTTLIPGNTAPWRQIRSLSLTHTQHFDDRTPTTQSRTLTRSGCLQECSSSNVLPYCPLPPSPPPPPRRRRPA